MKRLANIGFGEGITASFLVLLFLLIYFPTTHAASLSIESNGVNDKGALVLSVFVETAQKQPINAAKATIPFKLNDSAIQSVDTHESVFSLWNISPRVENGNTIVFSGGTPADGGYIFKGKLFDIILSLEKASGGTFDIESASIHAADGEGTDVLASTYNYSFATVSGVPSFFDTDRNGSVSLTELSIGLVR